MHEALLSFAAAALLLFAFALLALSQERHWSTVMEGDSRRARHPIAQRVAGLMVIALSLPVCLYAGGTGMGTLLWAFLTFAAAFTVSLCLTWWPNVLVFLALVLARW